MTGQNDRQDRSLTGQVRDQAGHCPLTGRYLQPWARENNKARKQFSLEYSRLGIVPHFLQGKYASAREFSLFPPRVTSSRVAIFTLVLVFRSLFYP